MTKAGRLTRGWRRVQKNPAVAMRRFVKALDRMDRRISGYHIDPKTWDNYVPSGLNHNGGKP